MKKKILNAALLLCIFIFSACDKSSTSPSTPATAKCKPLTESSNFNGGNITYTYTYNTDGTPANIKYPPYNMVIGYSGTSITHPASVRAGFTDSTNTGYTGNIYTGSATTATQSITLDGITYKNYKVFNFSYDLKNRLAKVIETTPNVANDVEYQLTIIYNDQDNVSQLKYESYNGPAFLTVINATGYDDNPSPYTGIKNWHLFMHAAWNNYDPAPIFAALSKNNPLGFNGDISPARTMAYTYNDKGYPAKRVNTNTNSSGTYTFEEIYTYQCE